MPDNSNLTPSAGSLPSMAGITTDFQRRDSILIPRPQYAVLDLQSATQNNWDGYQITEKMDGRWHEIGIGKSRIVGELMRDGSFFAFDIPVFNGCDLRRESKVARLEFLDRFKLKRPAQPQRGETPEQFMTRILSAGGEGVVISNLESPWGCDIWKAKRRVTYDCAVTEIHAKKLSIHLAFEGQDAGWCPSLNQSIFDQINIGHIVEIAAYGRHVSGKFREPRFIRSRPDKMI